MIRQVVLLGICFVWLVHGKSDLKNDDDFDRQMHDFINRPRANLKAAPINKDEETAAYWKNQAESAIEEQLKKKPNTGVAKNVILFLGDGMSIPTLTAARAYIGQKNNKPGEETVLSFEKFPYVGLSKTYCVDGNVPDSACSSTAYLSGVKANEGTLGVSAAVKLKDCKAMNDPKNHVESIAKWSQKEGKRTGIVTTTRITNASPAGIYAHTAFRDWESDDEVLLDKLDPKVCQDVAQQLLSSETAKELNVILGGGWRTFLPETQKDPDGNFGHRKDKRNLIDEWKKQKEPVTHKYVDNREDLLKVSGDTEYLMGLFSSSHIDYRLKRPKKQPSLVEMTETAIRLLSQGDKGYFLFVEGGRIDHGHHGAMPRAALDETEEFHLAIEAALKLTNTEDTLIVVTADHAHTMSINGYPDRGHDILGIGGMATDGLPFTTLTYANGPGYRKEENGKRHNVSEDDLSDIDYHYIGLFPTKSETHGGDDVTIYALGPWAHLVNGVLEQNVIPYIMAYASCVGDGDDNACNSTANLTPSFILQAALLLVILKQSYRML